MSPLAIVKAVREAGADLFVRDDGRLVVRPASVVPDDLMVEVRASAKQLIATLAAADSSLSTADSSANSRERVTSTQKAACRQLSDHGRVCRLCRRLDRVYPLASVGDVCASCVEWFVDCSTFVVLATANEDLEKRHGACLRCGASWTMHGSPDASAWRRASDCDDVVPARARFVLAAAREIVAERAR